VQLRLDAEGRRLLYFKHNMCVNRLEDLATLKKFFETDQDTEAQPCAQAH